MVYLRLKLLVASITLSVVFVVNADGAKYDSWPGKNNNIGLIHRWSFEGNLKDSVGAANAVLRGSAELKDGAVCLKGGAHASSFIDIAGPVIPHAKTPFTLEIWATMKSVQKWSRLFTVHYSPGQYLNNNGWRDICWAWSKGSDAGAMVLKFFDTESAMTPGCEIDKKYHFVMRGDVNNVTKGYDIDAIVYEEENAAPRMSCKVSFDAKGNLVEKMHALALGKSAWKQDNDACAEFDEVRIWNRALTDEELVLSNESWANVVPKLSAYKSAKYERALCPDPQWFVSDKEFSLAYSLYKVDHASDAIKAESKKRMGGINDYRRKMVKEALLIWKKCH